MSSPTSHDDTLVLADGQNGDWTPHDLRRTSATMMQALGVSLDAIDHCQNHVLAGSRVRRHYLHHDYAGEKKRAWNLLGDRLSAVLYSTYEHTPTESMLSFPAFAATETWSPRSIALGTSTVKSRLLSSSSSPFALDTERME